MQAIFLPLSASQKTASGPVNGQVGISVLSYQPGRPNSDAELRQTLSSTFAAFSLNATMEWKSSELVAY